MDDPRHTNSTVWRRLALVAVCAQLALIVTGILANRDGGLEAQSESFRLLVAPPTGQSLSIESALPAALDYARTWSPGARLFAASMQIDWPDDGSVDDPVTISPSGWILLTFGTTTRGGQNGDHATLSIMIDRVSGYVLDERAMAWSREPEREVDPPALAISTDVALFAAELTGGRDYRFTCPEQRRVSRIGLVPGIAGENPYWLVTYEDARDAGRPAYEIEIDGVTGDVRRTSAATAAEPCP